MATTPLLTSQWRDPLEEYTHEIERAQTLGRALYENDLIAAWATDALVKAGAISKDKRLCGYLTTQDGASRQARFIGQVGSEYCELYTVEFSALSPTAATVHVLLDPIPLAGDRKSMFLARQTATNHPVKLFTESYNTVVLPGSLVQENDWLVYLLAATLEPDTALLGGSYRLRISHDGANVLSATALSGSLLRFSPCPKPGENLFVTYGLSQMPIETHVHFQLAHQVRLKVGIIQKMAMQSRFVEWRIEGGKIVVGMLGKPENNTHAPQPTKYRFKSQVLCPFCGRSTANTTIDVDMNTPLGDMAGFDVVVPALPCCSPCKARYVQWNNRSLDLPLVLGYPLAILHRLTYRTRVREWLRQNAEVVENVDT